MMGKTHRSVHETHQPRLSGGSVSGSSGEARTQGEERRPGERQSVGNLIRRRHERRGGKDEEAITHQTKLPIERLIYPARIRDTARPYTSIHEKNLVAHMAKHHHANR